MCSMTTEIAFKRRLKSWRGKLLQKEAASLLGVNLRTYERWESGAEPRGFVRKLLESKMDRIVK